MKSSISAIIRIIHLKLGRLVSYVPCAENAPAYPTRSTKILATIGRIVPPSDAPAEIMPDANDLRFSNHCATIEGSGQNNIPQANPVKRP